MSARTIAIDAFGGDRCPEVEIEAAVRVAREGIDIVLVGDRERVEAGLARVARGERSRLPIAVHNAGEVIAMDDAPARAVRQKPGASMPVCFDLVKSGAAGAVVSAGNSGAMLACGLFKFRRIRGVDRPAIVTTFPNLVSPTVLIDTGANVECRVINLVQFAVMGAVYAKFEHGRRLPKVGVLANGSEVGKGTELTRAADRLLTAHPSELYSYIGYVEGRELFVGDVDVIVTDGFTGNVMLKTAEGTSTAMVGALREAVAASSAASKLGALLMRPAFRELKRRADPDTYGGAPLVGVDGIAVICHGGASVKAMVNGVREAHRFARDGFTPGLAEAVGAHEELFAAARSHEPAG